MTGRPGGERDGWARRSPERRATGEPETSATGCMGPGKWCRGGPGTGVLRGSPGLGHGAPRDLEAQASHARADT